MAGGARTAPGASCAPRWPRRSWPSTWPAAWWWWWPAGRAPCASTCSPPLLVLVAGRATRWASGRFAASRGRASRWWRWAWWSAPGLASLVAGLASLSGRERSAGGSRVVRPSATGSSTCAECSPPTLPTRTGRADRALAPRRLRCEHVFVSMVICVLYPRFELLAALGDRRALLSEPAALAPEAGREQVVGEVSAPAEAFGVVRGMRLGEALARCPALRLVPPDPEGSRSLWGHVLDRLEGIGAAVESDRSGVAFFEARPLEGIHGGRLDGVLAAARRALGPGARFGAAPSRFAAHAAALRARPRRRARAAALPGAVVVEERAAREFLAPCRSRSCAPGPSCRRCRRSSSSSGSGRSASSPRSPRGRWPSGSATRGSWRSTWPGAATPSSSRGGRPSRSASGSTCPRRPRASSSSVPWSCSWPGCSPGASGAGARSGGSPCPRASWPEAPGG